MTRPYVPTDPPAVVALVEAHRPRHGEPLWRDDPGASTLACPCGEVLLRLDAPLDDPHEEAPR